MTFFIHPDSATIREDLQRFARAQEEAADDKFQLRLERAGISFKNVQAVKASSSVVHFQLMSQYIEMFLRNFKK